MGQKNFLQGDETWNCYCPYCDKEHAIEKALSCMIQDIQTRLIRLEELIKKEN